MQFYRPNSISSNFFNNTLLIKLIYANLLVFLTIQFMNLPLWLMQSTTDLDYWVMNWFAVPADLGSLATKPWTLFSYMFLHLGLGHLFGNMLWLFFLGQIFVEFLGERKLWSVYIAGGLAGALLYIIFFNVFPVFETVTPHATALGASASVMAIVVAIGAYRPDFSIRLFLVGNVKLKYIALISVFLDVISISNSNSGGHIAHLGGAALGFFFARQWAKGRDITAWVNTSTNFVKAIFASKPKSKMKVQYRKSAREYEYSQRKKDEERQVDEILDKISRSGYDSLSKKEKDILFRASNKN